MGKKKASLKDAALAAGIGAATLGTAALAKKYYDVHHGPTWPFNKEFPRRNAAEWGKFQSNVQLGEGARERVAPHKKTKKKRPVSVEEEDLEQSAQILEQATEAH